MRARALLAIALLALPVAAASASVRLAFALEESDLVYEGDIQPGQAVAYEVPLEEPNLTHVSFVVEWRGTGDASGLAGPETFRLDVANPMGGLAGSARSSDGRVAVDADANPLPASVLVAPDDVGPRAAAATGHAGQGEWRATIRMDGAGALDRGNHYRLTVRALHYAAVPMVPQTGGPDYGTMANDPARAPLGWMGAAALLALAAVALAVAAFVRVLVRPRPREGESALPRGDNTGLEKR